MSVSIFLRWGITLVLLCGLKAAWAQTDTLTAPADTLALADTLAISDAIPIESTFNTVVNYQAMDSIRFDMRTQSIQMFGKAKMDYGEIKLSADRIDVYMEREELHAEGTPDKRGRLQETPVFEQKGQDPFDAEEITYNFKTKKALVKQVRTTQDEGFVISERSKKVDDETFYSFGNIYTTCDLEHPHFGIRSEKIKLINKKQVISGPFQLVINDVPTPVGFPFAILPVPRKRTSGIVMPTYGETRENGFFLRDGGFYWAVSDYVDLAFLGEIHTRGRYGGRLQSRYKKRYAFDGSLGFRFNIRNSGERGTPEFAQERDFWLEWSHTPTPKGDSRFSASVQAGTAQAQRNNSFNPQDQINTAFNSNISYSTRFGKNLNFSSSLRHNQNVETEIVKVSPQIGLSMNRIFPFKNLIPSTKRRLAPLRDFGITYNLTTQTELTNDINQGTGNVPFETNEELPERKTIGFNFANASRVFGNAEFGAQHRVSAGTSLTLARYFNLNPSFNYTENWYFQKYDYEYLGEGVVDVDTIPSFQRAFNYTSSVGVSTRLYGFYFFNKRDRQSGNVVKSTTIRQLITPNLSFSYNPNFRSERFGFYKNVQTDDSTGVAEMPRFGGIYAVPGNPRAGSINFSVTNQFELKKETSDGSSEKIKLLDNLGFSTSYNLAADSLNLSPINLTVRTTLFGKLNINVSTTLQPYVYDVNFDDAGNLVSQRRINKFAWNEGQGLGRIERASIALSTSLNPNTFKAKSAASEEDQDQVNYINQNRDLYVDFSVPWSLNLNYNLSYSRTGFNPSQVTQTLNFSGDVNLTPKWKIGFRSGYDFQLKELSFTSIDINRDLHCWRMSVNWVPFGPRQSYSFEIGVQSAILRDLKLQRRNNWRDRL